MSLTRAFRLVLAGMIAATVPIGAALAQTPAPAASSAPAASPTPAASATPAPVASPTPTPAASATPAPTASPTPEAATTPTPTPTPSAPPTSAASPSPAPSPPPAAAQANDPFGEPLTLEAKKVVTFKGNANWDGAFETLIDSFKALTALLDKQGVKATGNPMIVYTSTDDTGFTFIAEIPVAQDVKNLGKNMSMGTTPEGKALKFVHRGSYDNMDNTYEAITNHLDEKKLEAKDLFVEEYITDPLKTAEDKLIINVYVPLK